MEVKILKNIDANHQLHYWYGGNCVEIKHKGYTAYIAAVGDVYAYLYDDSQEELASVIDKNNGGDFLTEMSKYINNDEELLSLIKNEQLIFLFKNWWECCVVCKNGKFHDLMWNLESDYLCDAIEEVKEELDEQILYIEQQKNYKFSFIDETRDKQILYRELSSDKLFEINNILEAYSCGRIDFKVPRLDNGEPDFDGEFELINNDNTYEETGSELLVMKWVEGYEDTGYLIECLSD